MKKPSILFKAASLLLCAPLIAGTFSAAAPVMPSSSITADAAGKEEVEVSHLKFNNVLFEDIRGYYTVLNEEQTEYEDMIPTTICLIQGNEYGDFWGNEVRLKFDIDFDKADEYASFIAQARKFESMSRRSILDLEVVVEGTYDSDTYDKTFDRNVFIVKDIVRIKPQGMHYFGDVNDDGTIDTYDLICLRQLIANDTSSELTADQFKNSDLNKNGSLDEEDLQQLNDYLLGSASGFNVPSEIGSVRLDDKVSVEAAEGTEVDDKFSAAQIKFGINVLKQLNSDPNQKKDNMLISPFSAAAALTMTANGADGETLKEMESVLGDDMSIDDLNNYMAWYLSNLPNTSKEKMLVADSIWFKDKESFQVYDSFLEANKKFFNAEIYKTPFDRETVKDVNSWVNLKTSGMIPSLLGDDAFDKKGEDEPVMCLVNTVFFDAEWASKYERSNTTNFTNDKGEKKDVEGLFGGSTNYYELDNAIAFKKSYAGKYKFVGILPDEDLTLDEYIDSIDPAKLSEQLKNPGDMENTVVSTMIPEFEYDYSCTLKDTLKEIGMPSAFTRFGADFSKINDMSVKDADELYIGDVIQKTKIELTKDGTKAAAATAVIMYSAGCMQEQDPPRYIYIYLNRPFVYMIVDENDVPVFIGTVKDLGK